MEPEPERESRQDRCARIVPRLDAQSRRRPPGERRVDERLRVHRAERREQQIEELRHPEVAELHADERGRRIMERARRVGEHVVVHAVEVEAEAPGFVDRRERAVDPTVEHRRERCREHDRLAEDECGRAHGRGQPAERGERAHEETEHERGNPRPR